MSDETIIAVVIGIMVVVIALGACGMFRNCPPCDLEPPVASIECHTPQHRGVQMGGAVLTNDPYFVGSPAPVIRGIGCYADDSRDRAMREWVFGTTLTTFDQCQQGAIDKQLKYFGLQNAQTLSTGEEVGVCFGTDDLASAKKYGASLHCKPADGNTNKYHAGKDTTNYVYEIV
jgi:hypothetical protein